MELVGDIYLFDVDGTLTPPRQKMTKEFYSFFKEWIEDKEVYLVSGSDYEKLEEQLPSDILEGVGGVFGCMGNTYHTGGIEIMKRNFEPPEELLEILQKHLDESQYKKRCGNHIEKRVGMVNFSVLGRDATHHERQEYHAWDLLIKERKKIADEINSTFDEFEASLGGEISIDIYPAGWDKQQVYYHLPDANYFFFGDKTLPGGNDFSLAHVLTELGHVVYNVSDFKETWKILAETTWN